MSEKPAFLVEWKGKDGKQPIEISNGYNDELEVIEATSGGSRT